MASRTVRKTALTVLALGGASAAVVFGSFAAWTATTNNPGNSVSTGSLTLTNSKPAAAVFAAATNVKPGDTGGDSVTITNGGTAALDLTLDQDTVVQGAGAALELQVFDGTNCVYPVAVGACVAYAAWDGSAGGLNNLSVGSLAGGAGKTFTVNWRLNSSSGNTDQNTTNSFRLVWDGAQA
jgi:hypothetical protein